MSCTIIGAPPTIGAGSRKVDLSSPAAFSSALRASHCPISRFDVADGTTVLQKRLGSRTLNCDILSASRSDKRQDRLNFEQRHVERRVFMIEAQAVL